MVESRQDIDGLVVSFTQGVVRALKLAPRNTVLECGAYRFSITVTSLGLHVVSALVKRGEMLDEALYAQNSVAAIRLTVKKSEHQHQFIEFKGTVVLADEPDSNGFTPLTIALTDNQSSVATSLLGPVISIIKSAGRRVDARIVTQNYEESDIGIDLLRTYIQIPTLHRCYVIDFSSSGAGIIATSDIPVHKGDAITLVLGIINEKNPYLIEAIVKDVRTENEGKYPLTRISVSFIAASTPIGYKIFLNDILLKLSADARRLGRP